MRANTSLRLVASRPVMGPARAAPADDRVVDATPASAHWFTADLARVLGAASVWGFAFSTFYLLPKYLAQVLGA